MVDDDMLGMFSAIHEAIGDGPESLSIDAHRVLKEHLGFTGSLLVWTRSGIDRAEVIAALRAAAGSP